MFMCMPSSLHIMQTAKALLHSVTAEEHPFRGQVLHKTYVTYQTGTPEHHPFISAAMDTFEVMFRQDSYVHCQSSMSLAEVCSNKRSIQALE